jgi:hypothetical protein
VYVKRKRKRERKKADAMPRDVENISFRAPGKETGECPRSSLRIGYGLMVGCICGPRPKVLIR